VLLMTTSRYSVQEPFVALRGSHPRIPHKKRLATRHLKERDRAGKDILIVWII
jgi:hypothetical protein